MEEWRQELASLKDAQLAQVEAQREAALENTRLAVERARWDGNGPIRILPTAFRPVLN